MCLLQKLHTCSYVTLLPDPVPMTEKHKDTITSNYEKLENLNADRVMVSLVSEGIITFDDQEKIKSEKTSKEQAQALLHLLVKRQDRAFYVLTDALKKCGSPELARILEMAGRTVSSSQCRA